MIGYEEFWLKTVFRPQNASQLLQAGHRRRMLDTAIQERSICCLRMSCWALQTVGRPL